MLFTGQSEHAIDAKQRLAVPAKYRNQWDAARDGAAWVCIPWPTGHLRLYTESEFQRLARQGEMTLTPDEDVAELQTTLFGLAERLEMDSAGRIVIPPQHLKLARISGDVTIVGAGNRLEIRGRGEWTESTAARFEALPRLVERIEARKRATFGPTPRWPSGAPEGAGGAGGAGGSSGGS